MRHYNLCRSKSCRLRIGSTGGFEAIQYRANKVRNVKMFPLILQVGSVNACRINAIIFLGRTRVSESFGEHTDANAMKIGITIPISL